MSKALSGQQAFRNANEAWRRNNVGRAIFEATRAFEQDVLKVILKEGFPEVRMVHLNLLRNLDLDGTRLTELATRANMTKQSMQELVDRVEDLGFIERWIDPQDRRAKLVVFSKRGLRLLDVIHKAVYFMESQMADIIGPAAVATITRHLRKYNAAKTV